MNEASRFGIKTLCVALLLGVLGDLLLRESLWGQMRGGGLLTIYRLMTTSGLSITVMTTLVVASVIGLARWGRLPLEGGGRWLLIPAIGFGLCFAWRDSFALKCFDALAILMAFGLASWRSRRGQIRCAAFTEAALGLLFSALNGLFGIVPLVFQDIQWKAWPGSTGSRHLLALGRGLLLALPLVLIFGGLFMAADAGFERLVHRLFHFDMESIASHLLLITCFSWGLAGFLRHLLEEPPLPLPSLPRAQTLTLGIVELGTALGLLDLLFLAFLSVQVGYLFGGKAHLFAVPGLTAADYARRGFFELVAVAALIVPLLLLADWLLRKETPRIVRLFRAMSGALVVLNFAVMFSAAQRLWLYYVGYGLTETRFYVAAFMVWLATTLLWLAWTLLRGNRQRFVFGAIATAFGCLAVLNILNPDAFILNANVSRFAHGRDLDASYLRMPSADATPALVASLPLLPPTVRAAVIETLWQDSPADPDPALIPAGSLPAVRDGDWRSWNWSRAAAYRALKRRNAP
jgi:hypothetical protein